MPKKLRISTQTTKTFEEGVEEFLLNCEARNLRNGTLKHYRDSIKQLYRYIPPDTLISDIDEVMWDSFKIAMRNRGDLNDVSMFTYGRDMKTILRFFMKQEWMPKFDLHLPKTDKAPTETYTNEELRRLLAKPNLKKCNFVEYRCWVIINFVLSTGLRQNSLINIRIKDIDFDAEVIYVNITKSRKPLVIPMNKDLQKILKEYLKYRQGKDENDYLFCNQFGEKMTRSTVYHSIYDYNHRRAVSRTGVHRLRHTMAKQWVLMGGNVVSLQKLLGHSNLEITQNYLNILVSDIKKDVDEFNILRELKQEAITMKERR